MALTPEDAVNALPPGPLVLAGYSAGGDVAYAALRQLLSSGREVALLVVFGLAIASLIQLVTSSNILFGTDFPPGGSSADVAKELAALKLGFTEADMRNIDRENAIKLVPRFAG